VGRLANGRVVVAVGGIGRPTLEKGGEPWLAKTNKTGTDPIAGLDIFARRTSTANWGNWWRGLPPEVPGIRHSPAVSRLKPTKRPTVSRNTMRTNAVRLREFYLTVPHILRRRR
jgi:hypothetical protein